MSATPEQERFVPLLLAAVTCLALACGSSLAQDEAPADAPPPSPFANDPAEDRDGPPDRLRDLDGTWTASRDPVTRYWEITPYLKGTAAQIRGILETQVMEFDGKLEAALAEIKQNEREERSETKEALAVARATPAYQAAQQQADAAKAELDAARAAGESVEQRMSVSARYNKAKAELDKLDRAALAKTSAATLKATREKLQERVNTFYVRRAEALAWRQKLVNAVLLGQTIRGRIVPGETVGLLVGAKIERVTEDKAVLATFPLMQSHEVIGDKEGVKQIQGRVQQVRLLIRGVDDVHRLRPKQEWALWQVFKVKETTEIDGKLTYVLDPYPCDFNVLLGAITKPPAMKAPTRGITLTTRPSPRDTATKKSDK